MRRHTYYMHAHEKRRKSDAEAKIFSLTMLRCSSFYSKTVQRYEKFG